MSPQNLHFYSRILVSISPVLFATACTVVGPDYQRPTFTVPSTYKESDGNSTATQQVKPMPAAWWKVFDDPQLDALIKELQVSNQTLLASEARARRARTMLQLGQSATVTAGGRNDLGLLVNWEIDLWGRIQRTIEANAATAQASLADLSAARLSLQAQLAQNYFMLRAQDSQIQLLNAMVQAYTKELQISRNRKAVGIGVQTDISRVQSLLNAVQLRIHNAQTLRAQFEHAIAILIGKVPADFSLVPTAAQSCVPLVPAELPAQLLVRRPDIAAAERRMAAASAKIGVTEAKTRPSLDFFVGVSIRKGVLGGANLLAQLAPQENLQAARNEIAAAYDEVVADYRQAVLNGLREVEDSMVSVHELDLAAVSQTEVVKSATEATRVLTNQYQAGIIDYSTLVMVQISMLENQFAETDIQQQRFSAAIALIKALGGGWNGDLTKLTVSG